MNTNIENLLFYVNYNSSMSAKNLFQIIVIVFLFISCSEVEQFPPKQFQKANPEEVKLNGKLFSSFPEKSDSTAIENYSNEFNSILQLKTYYDENNAGFKLENLEEAWNELQIKSETFGFEDVKKWIEITGFLMEITRDNKYADELEKTFYLSSQGFSEPVFLKIEEFIIPWIFTKNVDHIQVNLFVNSTIKYEHTLKGAVEITQETSYPELGKVQIQFKMENKRYIELFIRIPEWAQNVSIVEKGVKYVATPGTYAQIVRKWKEGDVVEIEFSTNNKPDWMK